LLPHAFHLKCSIFLHLAHEERRSPLCRHQLPTEEEEEEEEESVHEHLTLLVLLDD
jgi:hypothetical protein